MNANETLRLLDAGFTAEEIRKMENDETPPAGNEDTTKPEPGAGNSEHESQVMAPEVSEAMKTLTGEVEKLTETVKKIQEMNIKNAGTGSPKTGDPVNEQINSFLEKL